MNDIKNEGYVLFPPGRTSYDAMITYLKEHEDWMAVALVFSEKNLRWWIVHPLECRLIPTLLYRMTTLFQSWEVTRSMKISMANLTLSFSCIHEILQPHRPCRLFFDVEDGKNGAGSERRVTCFIRAVQEWTRCQLTTSCERHGDDLQKRCGHCRLSAMSEEATYQVLVFSASSPSKMSFHVIWPMIVLACLERLQETVASIVAWIRKRRSLYADCFRANGDCIVDESFYGPYQSMRLPFMFKIEKDTPIRPLQFVDRLSFTPKTLSKSELFELGSIQWFTTQHVQAGFAWMPSFPTPTRIIGYEHGPRPSATPSSAGNHAPTVQLEESHQKAIMDFLMVPERLGSYWDRSTAKYVKKIGAYWTFFVENGRHPQFCPGMAVLKYKGWGTGEKPPLLIAHKTITALKEVLKQKRVYLSKSLLPKKIIERKTDYMHHQTSNVSIRVTEQGEVIAFCRERCCPKGVRIFGPSAELRVLYQQCIKK